MRTAEVVECARGMSVAEEEVRRWRACAGSVYVANVVASEEGWILIIWEAAVAGMCSLAA